MVRTSTPNDGKKRGRVGGTWRRVSGREDLDQAMRSRFDPYSYESNWKTLRWLVAFLGVWIVLSIALAFNDNQTASYLEEISDMGLTTTPPGDIFPATVVEYSKIEGIACDSVEEVVTFTEPCQRVVDIQRAFNSRKDRGNLMFAGLIVLLIIIAFPFSTVIHRASRNLPTLKSSGQRYSPDSAVIWFFVPIVIYRQTGAVDHGAFQGQRPIRKRQRNRGLETNRQDSRYRVYLGAGLGRGVYFQPDTRTEGLLPPRRHHRGSDLYAPDDSVVGCHSGRSGVIRHIDGDRAPLEAGSPARESGRIRLHASSSRTRPDTAGAGRA